MREINNELAEIRMLPNPDGPEKEAQFRKMKFSMGNCEIAHIHTVLCEAKLENTRWKQNFDNILRILEVRQWNKVTLCDLNGLRLTL